MHRPLLQATASPSTVVIAIAPSPRPSEMVVPLLIPLLPAIFMQTTAPTPSPSPPGHHRAQSISWLGISFFDHGTTVFYLMTSHNYFLYRNWTTLPSGSWPSQALKSSPFHSLSCDRTFPTNVAALARTSAILETGRQSFMSVSSRISGGTAIVIVSATYLGTAWMTNWKSSELSTIWSGSVWTMDIDSTPS
ncbi:MAG: hypothetical protein HC852_04420 [Acaryochloridaceae cyanobacterium RU_4_10]|nr:hypothetical protein [Acaryochloridaceae cyanobacterium RU_4_10]